MLSTFFQRKVIEHRSAKTNRGKSLCKDQQECGSSQWRNEILFGSDRRGRGERLFSAIWRSLSLTQQISTEDIWMNAHIANDTGQGDGRIDVLEEKKDRSITNKGIPTRPFQLKSFSMDWSWHEHGEAKGKEDFFDLLFTSNEEWRLNGTFKAAAWLVQPSVHSTAAEKISSTAFASSRLTADLDRSKREGTPLTIVHSSSTVDAKDSPTSSFTIE